MLGDPHTDNTVTMIFLRKIVSDSSHIGAITL